MIYQIMFIFAFISISVSLNVHLQRFTGNSEKGTIKYDYFQRTFETRFLRIYPEEYNTREYRCLELIEVYGCSDNTCELIYQPPALNTTV